MEVYTCDSVSYVICRNLTFLMLDLETSGLLYSAMFCTNQKNAFLFRKSSVLIPNCQSYSSEKQRKSNIFSLLYICCPSCGRNPKALPLLIPCRSILYLSLPVGRMDGRQVGARAGLQASVCMFTRIFIHANSHSVRLASIHADITTLLRPLILSFSFFFWAA